MLRRSKDRRSECKSRRSEATARPSRAAGRVGADCEKGMRQYAKTGPQPDRMDRSVLRSFLLQGSLAAVERPRCGIARKKIYERFTYKAALRRRRPADRHSLFGRSDDRRSAVAERNRGTGRASPRSHPEVGPY